MILIRENLLEDIKHYVELAIKANTIGRHNEYLQRLIQINHTLDLLNEEATDEGSFSGDAS